MTTPITRKQREALKRIFMRRPIYKGGASSEIAMQAGWSFVAVKDLPDNLRSKITNMDLHYVWIHGQYATIYAESDDIVADYGLSERITYRQFRKTVQHGHDCLMVAWQNMWLGIEKDGYTHS